MTGFLIDTHVLLWWLVDDPALSTRAKETIADRRSDALVSTATAWEIAIKRQTGKLEAPEDLLETVVAQGFAWLPITADHAWAVGELPRHHGDPFDRLLIAQARVEKLSIVTADENFGAYDVDVRW